MIPVLQSVTKNFFLLTWRRVDVRIKQSDFIDPTSTENHSMLTCFCPSNDRLILLLNENINFKSLKITGKTQDVLNRKQKCICQIENDYLRKKQINPFSM